MLGVPSPPAFADPSTVGDKIVNGVNYASAAGGILDESGRHYVRTLITHLSRCIISRYNIWMTCNIHYCDAGRSV